MALACPEGSATCNDVSGVSLLVPLFPIVMIAAVLLGLALGRHVPRRGLVGWPLAFVGAAAYLYFSSSGYGSFVGAFGVILGVALARGRRQSLGVSSSSDGTGGPRFTGSVPKE